MPDSTAGSGKSRKNTRSAASKSKGKPKAKAKPAAKSKTKSQPESTAAKSKAASKRSSAKAKPSTAKRAAAKQASSKRKQTASSKGSSSGRGTNKSEQQAAVEQPAANETSAKAIEGTREPVTSNTTTDKNAAKQAQQIANRKLWEAYGASRSEELREEIILQYAPLVKYVMGRLAISLPAILDYEDILSSGTIGLIEAVERFSSSTPRARPLT